MRSSGASAGPDGAAASSCLKFSSDGMSVIGICADPPKDISIPSGVVEIGESAFEGSGIEIVKIPNFVKRICSNAFYNCHSLKSITLPESLETIGSYFCRGCSSLSSITIPQSATHICSYAFWDCTSLSSVIIPLSVTHIGEYAFEGCSSLSSISISSKIIKIDDGAFKGCVKVKSILLPEIIASIRSTAFDECSCSLREAFCRFSVLLSENGFTHRHILNQIRLKFQCTSPLWLYSEAMSD